jgi:hypothetical protein
VEFFTHLSFPWYLTHTKPLGPLPDTLPIAEHLLHSRTEVVGAGAEGWLFTTELEPCFTHLSLLPTFLQTNFVPETTLTALDLVQLSADWAGDATKVPIMNASTKVIDANCFAVTSFEESDRQAEHIFLEAARIKAPQSLSIS